jgi:hypothetical protein
MTCYFVTKICEDKMCHVLFHFGTESVHSVQRHFNYIM